jgi:hypothetical protein
MRSPERLSADHICWEPVGDHGPDYQDLDLTDVVITAFEEAQSYRFLAQHAIHLLHVQDVQLKQLRAQNNRSRRTKVERRRQR